MKIFLSSIALILIAITTSCHWIYPRVGKYPMTLDGQRTDISAKEDSTFSIEITLNRRTYIVVNGVQWKKSGHNVEGDIIFSIGKGVYERKRTYHCVGKIKRENKKHYISGTYSCEFEYHKIGTDTVLMRQPYSSGSYIIKNI